MANVIPKSHISASAKATSVNVGAAPSSTVIGDYLVAEVTVAGVTALTSAPNSSWSLIHAAPAGSGLYHGVWAKFATSSSDGTGTWTANGATSISVTITGYANVDSTSPVRMHTSTTANGISITPLNATGLTANDEVVISTATTAGPRPWPDTGALLGCLPNGGPTVITQAAMVSFEAAGNTRCAVGNGWTSWIFSSPWPPAGNTTGANCDFANNRLTNLSWPTEQTWPQTGAKGTAAGDPTITFNAINNGTYDTLFAQNALKMKQYNHPMWFRPYCEMEGGDHPWEAGWVVGSASGYATAFNQAWRRLWIITKGTQAQVNALSPAYGGGSVNGGAAIQADNVLFFWNPTNTIQLAQATRDNLYPGDAYVQMAGTEAYVPDGPVSNSYSQTLDNTLTGAGGTEVPIYTYFTPGNAFSAGGKIIGHGESGNRWKGSGDTSACVTRTNTFSVIQSHPGVKMFIWWNGGSTGGAGLSKIDDSTYPAAVLTAVQNFFALPYMHPTLDNTLTTPAGWNEIYQYRARLGGTDTNYGSGMSGTQTMYKTSTSTSVTAPVITGYGYADYSAITFALVPTGGSSTNVAPNGGTVTIDNLTPNYDGVHTVALTATPSGWQGNPAIIGGDYSYQWQRVGSGSGVSTVPSLTYDFIGGNLTSTQAFDSSGHTNTGTLHGFSGIPPTSTGPSVNGNAVTFHSGSSQYIEAADSSSLDTPSVWTIDCWINPTLQNGVGDRWTAVSKGHCWELQVRTGTGSDGPGNTNHVRLGCFFGGDLIGNWVTLDSTSPLQPNVWTHIAGRYDGAHVALFIDGVKGGTDIAEVRTPNTNAETFHVGMHQQTVTNPEGPTNYFDGKILLPHVFKAALSDADIATLSAGFSPNIAYGFEADSISGSTITDDSGNNVVANGVNMPSPTLVASTSGHSRALQFNYASSQFLTIDNTSGKYDYPSWTLAAWVFFNPSQGPTSDGGGSRWEIMEHSQSFWVNIRGDTTPPYLLRSGGFFGGSTSITEYDSVSAIVPNTWTHIAVTYDQSNIRWYINGTLNKTQVQTGATNASTANPLVIGAKHRVSPSLLEQAYYNGAMDEFVMYNSALTGAQIATLVNSTFGSGSTTNIGTNSNQYTVVSADVGSKLQVNLTVNNGVAPNGTASAITAAVTNSGGAPVNTVPPTVPASPVVGILQTATQGTWTGASSFSYQWQHVTSNGASNIVGATSLTYTPVSGDLNTRLQIAVTAWQNAGQTGAATTVTSAASSLVTTSSSVYPSYLNYPTFTGLPSTTDSNYTSFNGVVDAASAANTEENRAARACVRVGTTDYWGGSFTLATTPGGSQVTRTNLASVNAANGALLSWSPTLDGPVRGLTVSPDSQYLYAVGDFNHVNGSIRNGAAKFKLSDGTLDATWAPSANGSVRGVAVSPDNTTVYISGNFTTINGSSRVLAAAVDSGSGALLTAFKPAFSDSLGSGQVEVRKIMFAPNDTTHIYCAGYFDTITNNGVISTRLALAQLNVSDGSVTSWHADLTGNTGTTIGHDMDFLSNGSAIFAAFAGSDSGGDGNTFIRYNLSPVSNTRVWNAMLDGDVNSIATNDTYVWAGTHGDGTQNVSTISNVGTRKICCVRASDGTDTVSGGQKHSLWTPTTQFNGIKGTYILVCADNALLCGGGWSTPNQSATSFAATGTALSEFTMQANTLSGITLVPGASAQVAINFAPALVGPRTATMTITDNASGSPRSVVLNGTGITSGPVIATTPASTVDFGQVQLINTSTTATFTFTDSTPGVTFLANLDNAPFVTVTSPWTYSNLSVGTHTFFLKANNAAGDSSVASYTWVISA